jgi:hypothetical protein
MELKIITNEEAINLGLTGGGGQLEYIYGVCGKPDGTITERSRIHIKTGKKEILFETPEHKEFREKHERDNRAKLQ